LGDAMLGQDAADGHCPQKQVSQKPKPKPNDVRIVILSSIAGTMCSGMDLSRVPCPKDFYNDFGDYCVTKAIDAFHARHLQKELEGSGISVAAVHPGIIGTNLGAGNDGIVSLLYGSALSAPVRKGIPSGAATTLYCALSDEVPGQIEKGSFFYYNRAPQNPMGIIRPGRADHLCEDLHKLQMDLVKPYM